MGKMRMVYVEWLDPATHTGGWMSRDSVSYMTELHCESVGWLVSKHERFVRLALSMNENGELSEVLVIPRSCVKKIRCLK